MADNIDQDYIDRLFQIESGGNRFARTGSNFGPGQFSRDQFGKYGITDPYSVEQHTRAVTQEAGEHGPALEKALGRPPTPAELYMAHQQGLTGATALLTNPDTPAWEVIRPYYKSDRMARLAIYGNIPNDSPLKRLPVDQIPSSAFTQMWTDKWNRVKPTDIALGATGSPAGPPTQAGGADTLAQIVSRPLLSTEPRSLANLSSGSTASSPLSQSATGLAFQVPPAPPAPGAPPTFTPVPLRAVPNPITVAALLARYRRM